MDPKGHVGKTYPLFGDKELNQYEIAAIMSEELGRAITYVPVPIPMFAEILSQHFSPYFVQHITYVAQDCLDGIFSGMNDNVEKITGNKPLSMEAYIRKNKAVFGTDTAAEAKLLIRPAMGK
jgi:NAD(P)H dehydrogenase (quinone)